MMLRLMDPLTSAPPPQRPAAPCTPRTPLFPSFARPRPPPLPLLAVPAPSHRPLAPRLADAASGLALVFLGVVLMIPTIMFGLPALRWRASAIMRRVRGKRSLDAE